VRQGGVRRRGALVVSVTVLASVLQVLPASAAAKPYRPGSAQKETPVAGHTCLDSPDA
jgi:hypothetical protein